MINAVVENAMVPVIETGTGIVHVYVDKDAEEDGGLSIINAKTSRPSVCNGPLRRFMVHEVEGSKPFLALSKVGWADRKKLVEPIQFR